MTFLRSASLAILLAGAFGTSLAAKEGMYTPDQLPEISEVLCAAGLEIDPETLTDVVAIVTKPFRLEALVDLLRSFPKGEPELAPAE
mgnify:CR=1 FL=1